MRKEVNKRIIDFRTNYIDYVGEVTTYYTEELKRLQEEINKILAKPKKVEYIDIESSIILHIKHIDDKPEFIQDEIWFFKKIPGEYWDDNKLYDEEYCRTWKVVGGNLEILENIRERKSLKFGYEVGSAVMFVNSDDLIDYDVVEIPYCTIKDKILETYLMLSQENDKKHRWESLNRLESFYDIYFAKEKARLDSMIKVNLKVGKFIVDLRRESILEFDKRTEKYLKESEIKKILKTVNEKNEKEVPRQVTQKINLEIKNIYLEIMKKNVALLKEIGIDTTTEKKFAEELEESIIELKNIFKDFFNSVKNIFDEDELEDIADDIIDEVDEIIDNYKDKIDDYWDEIDEKIDEIENLSDDAYLAKAKLEEVSKFIYNILIYIKLKI